MIHSVPAIDFVGALRVNSLEIGRIEVNDQSIPAVRFVLKQNKPYPILVSGHQAGEVYAYCAAALEKDIRDINVKIACTLLMDIDGNLHTITTHITWYTSSTLREHAAARLLNIFEKSTQSAFNTNDIPFIKIKS